MFSAFDGPVSGNQPVQGSVIDLAAFEAGPTAEAPVSLGALHAALARRLDAALPPPLVSPDRPVELFVGAPGAGKTTSLAKIAVRDQDACAMLAADREGRGDEALRRLAALGTDVRVLVLTMHEPEEYLLPALDAGAAGFLTKTSADDELVQAIRTVARGDAYLPPGGAQLLLHRYRSSSQPASSTQTQLEDLSAREEEVLALTAEGFSSSEIGKKLFISPKTVDTYRTRIMKKLDLHHRSELVRFALKAGLLRDV